MLASAEMGPVALAKAFNFMRSFLDFVGWRCINVLVSSGSIYMSRFLSTASLCVGIGYHILPLSFID